jgi:hypothetical protein
LKHQIKTEKATNMKMPVATKNTAAISGTTVGIILMTGENTTGVIHIILISLGTLWLIISSILFVMGRRPLEMNIGWMQGKQSFFAAQKDTTPRALIWFVSVVLTIFLFNLIIK